MCVPSLPKRIFISLKEYKRKEIWVVNCERGRSGQIVTKIENDIQRREQTHISGMHGKGAWNEECHYVFKQ